MRVQPLGREDPLEKEMATYSSILGWEIPWTEEPGGLQSMGSQSWTQLSNSTTTVALLLELFFPALGKTKKNYGEKEY